MSQELPSGLSCHIIGLEGASTMTTAGRERLADTIDLEITLNGEDVYLSDVEFEGWYEYDPGFWSYPNGDPGEPPSSDGEVWTTLSQEELEKKALESLTCEGDEPVPDWWEEHRLSIEVIVNEKLDEVVFDDVEGHIVGPPED